MDAKNSEGGQMPAKAKCSSEELRALKLRKYTMEELVETERTYVQDLSLIINGYMALMRDPNCEVPIPEELASGKDKIVFGNLEAIYEWHRDFVVKALENCIETPAGLLPVFKLLEKRLALYTIYCNNKPLSNYIIREFSDYFEKLRLRLGQGLQLADMLIKPIQRLTKYQLLIGNIHKHTKNAKLSDEIEAVGQVLVLAQSLPKYADDMMNVERINGFEGNILAYGKLLQHGPLICSEATVTKGKMCMVYLFEQIIIFTEVVGKKTPFKTPSYNFKGAVQTNKMRIVERLTVEGKNHSRYDSEPFIVTSTDPNSVRCAYTCQALTQESKMEWLHILRKIQQMQWDIISELTKPSLTPKRPK